MLHQPLGGSTGLRAPAPEGGAWPALSAAARAAVGPATARALFAEGLTAAIVPADDEQRQEGLVPALATRRPARASCSRKRSGDASTPAELAARGLTVDVVAVSQTVARQRFAAAP